MQNKTDNDKPPRRGAPVLPDELKRTARVPVRFWSSDYKKYESFCRQEALKMAEFLRAAARNYLSKTQHRIKPQKEIEGTPDVHYFVHFTPKEKEDITAYAKATGVKLSEFFRAAAEEYLEDH